MTAVKKYALLSLCGLTLPATNTNGCWNIAEK